MRAGVGGIGAAGGRTNFRGWWWGGVELLAFVALPSRGRGEICDRGDAGFDVGDRPVWASSEDRSRCTWLRCRFPPTSQVCGDCAGMCNASPGEWAPFDPPLGGFTGRTNSSSSSSSSLTLLPPPPPFGNDAIPYESPGYRERRRAPGWIQRRRQASLRTGSTLAAASGGSAGADPHNPSESACLLAVIFARARLRDQFPVLGELAKKSQ